MMMMLLKTKKKISKFLVGDTDVYKALVHIWVINVLSKLLITSTRLYFRQFCIFFFLLKKIHQNKRIEKKNKRAKSFNNKDSDL